MKHKVGQPIIYEETPNGWFEKTKRILGFIINVNENGYQILWCDQQGVSSVPFDCEYILDDWVFNYLVFKEHL